VKKEIRPSGRLINLMSFRGGKKGGNLLGKVKDRGGRMSTYKSGNQSAPLGSVDRQDVRTFEAIRRRTRGLVFVQVKQRKKGI